MLHSEIHQLSKTSSVGSSLVRLTPPTPPRVIARRERQSDYGDGEATAGLARVNHRASGLG